jgi:tetratricopeptide (TPR) repeat protein
MSDEETITTSEGDAAQAVEGEWWSGKDPFEFMGFDMNITRRELLETVAAWRGLIERFSREAEKDRRAAELVLRTRLRCGVACCVLEDWDAATADLEAVRDEEGAQPALAQAATWMLSSVYGALGQYERAIACWSAILAEYEGAGTKKGSSLPDKATMLYLFRAQAYAEQREWALAVDDCDRAERYHPECAEVFSVRGLARANLGDMDRALADCDRSVELEPGTARCYRRRGVVRRMRREFMLAIADFEQALELDSTDEHARTGRSEALLGYVLFEPLGSFDSAWNRSAGGRVRR